jgi:hypothetical protein
MFDDGGKCDGRDESGLRRSGNERQNRHPRRDDAGGAERQGDQRQ